MSGDNARREQAAIDASAWLARLSGEQLVAEDTEAFETWLAATSAGQIYKNGKRPYQLIDEATGASDTFWKLKKLRPSDSISVDP